MNRTAAHKTEQRTEHRKKGTALAVISILFLSTTGIFIAWLTKNYALPPLVLGFWRELLVAVFLGLFLLLFSPGELNPAHHNFRLLIPYGFILAVFNALWTFSVFLNGAAVGTVLVYTSPVFTAILGYLIYRERLTPLHIASMCLSVAGCILVSRCLELPPESLNIRGILTGLLSGVCYAVYTLMGQFSGRQKNSGSSRAVLFWIFLLASCFMFSFNQILQWFPVTGLEASGNLFHLGRRAAPWAVLCLLAGVPTLLGYGLYNHSLRYLPSLTVNLIASAEPAMTAVLAFLLLRERMSGQSVTGSLLITGAVLLIHLSNRK